VGTLVPGQDTQSSEGQIMGNVFDLLVRFKTGTNELVPALAEKYEMSADGKQLKFQLRKGVQFARGYGEFTSADVKFSFDRHKDPAFKSRYSADWQFVTSIDIPDKYTVVINFSQPSPGFIPSVITYREAYIVSKAAVEKLGTEFALKPVGTGPFYVDQVTAAGEFTLLANEQYYLGAPKLKKIIMKPISDPIVAWNALKSGDIDLTYTRSGEIYKQATADTKVQVKTAPSQSVRTVYFNTTRKPLDNPRVRQALAYATDKDAIVKQALDNTGQVGQSVLAPGTWSYTTEVKTYPTDLDKAKQLLSEAGLGSGFELTFTFTQDEPYPTIASVLQQQWAKVGVKVTLQGSERQAWTADSGQGKYDVTTIGLTRPQDPDVYFVQGWYGKSTPPGANYSYYNGADAAIDKVRTEIDPEKRQQLSVQVQKQIAEDVPGMVIYYPFDIAIMKPEVKNYTVGNVNELDLYPVTIG
jgi:peptide/nickel transport system substrate-binding protein